MVYAEDGSSNSFYIKVDQNDSIRWDIINLGEWVEEDACEVTLTAGNHTICIRGREANARLDYFYLTDITLKSGELQDSPDISSLSAYYFTL